MFIRGPRLWLLAPTLFFTYITYREGGVTGILVFFIVATLAMMYYDNRHEIGDVQRAKAKTAEQKKLQETPVRTTLPTEDETKMATAQLRVAWNIIERAQREKNINQSLSILEEAALPLSKVRELDPHATIEVKLDRKKDDTSKFTHDRMTAFMLYCESKWLDDEREGWHEVGMAIAENGTRSGLRKHHAETNKLLERSRAAIQRAVAYEPDHVPYLLHLAGHSSVEDRKKVIAHILKLEPYNVEALEIANRL